jgi:conjugal transfer protein trbB
MINQQEQEKKLSQLDEMVLNSLGTDILSMIDDDNVTEVYINEDHNIWKETFTGRVDTGIQLTNKQVTSICTAIAGYNNDIITTESPELGVELSSLMLRAQICYPPIVKEPIFFLRKKPRRIFSLEEYVASNSLSEKYYNLIVEYIKSHKNIVVVGGTGSGKTTFLNAMLKKLSELNNKERVLILEDTQELQCTLPDVLYLRTSGNKKQVHVTMSDLVFVSMRLSPNRIIVGEVRNQCAYDMIQAWNTGHEGGFCTTHANSAEEAFERLEVLIGQSSEVKDNEVVRRLIGNTVDVIISIQRTVSDTGTIRLIDDVIEVDRYDYHANEFVFTHK